MVPRVTHPHDQNGTNGESHRQQEADAARDLALESVNADVAGHDLLILADHDAARWLGQYRGRMPGAYLVEVDASGAFVSNSKHDGVGRGDVGTAMIAAEKPTYTWCSDDYEGRKLARDLHESIPKLRHIVQATPAKWLGQGFETILKAASPKKPPPIRKPQHQSEGSPVRRDPREPVDVSPGAIAARVIRKFGGELLIVRLPRRIGRRSQHKTEFSTGFALGKNGIWEASGDTWNKWLREIAAELRGEVIALIGSLGDGVVSRALNSIQRIRRPGMVQQVREMLLGELEGMQSEGERCSDVKVCRAEELDDDLSVIGAANGVVNLRTGRLLSPEEGRHYRVTVHAPVDYDPKATHEDVDKLFFHLDPLVRAWWWRVLGYHMWGSPSRRFYVVEGPKGGGKSTLANALGATLGPYCCRPQDSALEVSKVSAGLNPEQLKFGPPHRLALFLEILITRTSAEGIKRKTGNDSQSVRAPYELEETEIKNTATMFWFCNPGTAPRLRLQDEALADRLRVLPYPSVPEGQRDPGIVTRVEKDDDFKRAFLARLVAVAAAEKPGEPPDEPAAVRRATDDKISDDIGEFGEFARRLVLDETSRLTVAEAWAAWCAQCGSPETESDVGGITRIKLSRKLREYVLGLPRPKLIKVSSKQARGWHGWRLLSPEEVEAQEAVSTAEETAARTAKTFVQDLAAEFPVLSDEKRGELGQMIHQMLVKASNRIQAVFGSEWEQNIGRSFTLNKRLRVNLTEQQRDVLSRLSDVAELARIAEQIVDSCFPKSAAYQQAEARFLALAPSNRGRESRALGYLQRADRTLGSDATADELVATAVNIVVADANEELPFEPGVRVEVPALETTIKELCGLSPVSREIIPPGAVRPTMDQGGEN